MRLVSGHRLLVAFLAVASACAVDLGHAQSTNTVQRPPPADAEKEFVARVLGATEDVWHAVFQKFARRYEEPKLVLFTSMTQAGCGLQQARSGPGYCEVDKRIYLDLAFFKTLQNDYGAPGDFARAYVIAHEVGHHVQNLLGILASASKLEAKLDVTDRNLFSVRVELQADCLAGVWAGLAEKRWPGMLEAGDVEAGLAAAAAVGADRRQQAAYGVVVPETFTHGTSMQRMRWFKRGLEAATVQACDTFGASEL